MSKSLWNDDNILPIFIYWNTVRWASIWSQAATLARTLNFYIAMRFWQLWPWFGDFSMDKDELVTSGQQPPPASSSSSSPLVL